LVMQWRWCLIVEDVVEWLVWWRWVGVEVLLSLAWLSSIGYTAILLDSRAPFRCAISEPRCAGRLLVFS
jgi:hypothetical protein